MCKRQVSRIPKRDGNGRADSLPTSRFSARAAVMLLRRNVLRQLCVKGIIGAGAPRKKEKNEIDQKLLSNSNNEHVGKKNNVLGEVTRCFASSFIPV